MAYLSQSIMADDQYLRLRVSSCAAQEGCAVDAGIIPDEWTMEWRRVWAAGPGWAAKWEQAISDGIEEPGKEPDVITDSMIETSVRSLKPFTRIADHAPVMSPASPASREYAESLVENVIQQVYSVARRLDAAGVPDVGPLMIQPPPSD